jgi:hypothetical protein
MFINTTFWVLLIAVFFSYKFNSHDSLFCFPFLHFNTWLVNKQKGITDTFINIPKNI